MHPQESQLLKTSRDFTKVCEVNMNKRLTQRTWQHFSVLKVYLRSVDAEVGHSGDGLEDVAEDVDHGDGDDGLELSEELIRNPCSKNRGEVARAYEEMIDCCSFVLKW